MQTGVLSHRDQEAISSELAELQSLKKQLEDSLKRNAQLSKQLEKQLKDVPAAGDAKPSGELYTLPAVTLRYSLIMVMPLFNTHKEM